MLGLGFAQVASDMWDYNREIFKYDQNQRLKRDMAALEMRIKQFDLYREDVRDLVELTVGRMDIYHMVGAMLLQFIVVLFAEGRVEFEKEGELAPHWFMEIYYLSLGCAFIFLLMSVWLAMHASVAAQSFGTRMLTRFIRLPIPSADVLNKARTKLGQFERGGIRNIFRIPFITKAHTWRGDAGPAGSSDQPGKDSGMETIPAVPDDNVEGSFPYQVGDLPKTADEVVDGHIQLYRKLQGRWQSFDAYSRVAMALGFNQVIQAICTFIIMHMSLEQRAPWGAFIACLPLQFVSLVLLNLDIKHAQTWEFYMALAGSFGAPFANLAAIIFYHEAKHIPWLTRATVVLCFFFHAAWLIVARRFARPEIIDGVSLPFRFRSVLYLDVFADTAARKEAGNPGEARKEALVNLQKAMDESLMGTTAPQSTLRTLKAAAERCMDLVDSPEDDNEIQTMVMQAALHFEEQKLRVTESNVRRALKRWNSEAVQNQLTEYARGHVRKLEEQLDATQEELMNSTKQVPPIGGTRGSSLLSTGSCALLEIDYDTGYEQTSFYYNRHTDEVIWEMGDGMEDRQRESLESLTAKVQNFRDEVDEFLQMSDAFNRADDVSATPPASVADPSTWDVRTIKTGASPAECKKDRQTDAAGNPVLQQASETQNAAPSTFQKIYKAASSAVMPRQDPELREAFRPIIAEHDHNIRYSPTGASVDKDLRKAASFVPGASDSARRRGLARRSRGMGNLRQGISFVGEKAFCDTIDAESVSPPERLPWGCVRGSLNAFCVMWVLAGVVGVLDVILPHSWWPWHGSPGATGPFDGHQEKCPEMKATLAYAYPTPHFEAKALRCSDHMVCENRFGLSWTRNGSSWNHVNTTSLDHANVYVGDRVHRLSGTPKAPFAISSTAAAAFDGTQRVVVYRLEPSSKMLYGVKVPDAPRSVDIHESELIILHANSTVVRYDLATGQFIASVCVRNDTLAACKSGHVLLIAVPGEISGGIIV